MRKDAQERRQAILESGISHYIQHREHLKLEAVAADAGVGIATLYRNFPTRTDLINEILGTITNRVREQLKTADALLNSSEASLSEVTENLLSLMASTQVDRLLVHIINHNPDTLPPPQKALYHECTNQIATLLETYRKLGGIHPSINTTTFLHGMLGCFAAARATENSPHPLEPTTLARIFFAGAIQPPPPIR